MTGLFEYELIGRQKTLHAIRYMLARQGRARHVANVFIQLEFGSGLFADKLFAPLRLTNLSSIGFPVLEDLDSFDRAFVVQRHGERDVLMLTHDLIDDQPAASRDTPCLELLASNIHSRGVFDCFCLFIGQSPRIWLKCRSRKQERLRLFHGEVDGRVGGSASDDDASQWQKSKS